MKKKYLMVGGPMHGRQIEADENASFIYTPEPASFENEGPVPAPRHTYRFMRFASQRTREEAQKTHIELGFTPTIATVLVHESITYIAFVELERLILDAAVESGMLNP
jgi:hypothetical protein